MAVLKISESAFNEHNDTSRVDASGAYQTTFSAEHAFVHLEVGSLVFTTPHKGMYLSEVELREVACRTRRRA